MQLGKSQGGRLGGPEGFALGVAPAGLELNLA